MPPKAIPLSQSYDIIVAAYPGQWVLIRVADAARAGGHLVEAAQDFNS